MTMATGSIYPATTLIKVACIDEGRKVYMVFRKI